MKKDIEFQSDDVRIYRGTVTAENADIDEIIESVGVSEMLDWIDEEEIVNFLESRGYTVTNQLTN